MRTYVRNGGGRRRANLRVASRLPPGEGSGSVAPMLLGLALGVIVAGAAPGPTVSVQDAGDKIAITLAAPGARSVTETAPPPLWPDEAVVATTSTDGEVFVGGAVNPAAASVEIGFGDGRLTRVPGVAAEAYADRARFFAGQVTSRDSDDDPTTIRV